MTKQEILRIFNQYAIMFPERKESFIPSQQNVARWRKDVREKVNKQYAAVQRKAKKEKKDKK